MKTPATDPFDRDMEDLDEERSFDALEESGARVRRQRAAILHTDDHVVVIDQPGFSEPVIAESGKWQLLQNGEAVDELLDLGPLYCVAPVEEGVSGVTVLARSPQGRAGLLSQMQSSEMEVVALALVRAYVRDDSGTIDVPLLTGFSGGTEPVGSDLSTVAAACRTEWRVRDSYVGFALLECRPRTAARHQVRLHLQAAGMPLAVDPQHEGPNRLMLSSFKTDYHRSRRHPERPLIERTSMHIESSAFRHPVSGQTMRFDARMARDFRAAVNQLGRYGRMPKG